VTVNCDVDALAATAAVGGLIAKEQTTPAWLIVVVCPPTVIVVDRAVVAGFAWTLKFTLPEPLPDVLDTSTHDAPATADHEQPDEVVTVTRS
jgi:hypothetical protein